MDDKKSDKLFAGLSDLCYIFVSMKSEIEESEGLLINILGLKDSSMQLEEIKEFCNDVSVNVQDMRDEVESSLEKIKHAMDILDTI